MINKADETAMMFCENAEVQLRDRKLFVHNLGELLGQTREGIKSCELDDNEIVTIKFNDGAQRKVNVACDSYMAIITDIARTI